MTVPKSIKKAGFAKASHRAFIFVLKFVRWMLQIISHQRFSCSCSAITDLLSHKPECEWKHELNRDMNMNTDAENNTDMQHGHSSD